MGGKKKAKKGKSKKGGTNMGDNYGPEELNFVLAAQVEGLKQKLILTQ